MSFKENLLKNISRNLTSPNEFPTLKWGLSKDLQPLMFHIQMLLVILYQGKTAHYGLNGIFALLSLLKFLKKFPT